MIADVIQRHRELTAPGHILNLFESAELEELEQQIGQTHLPITMSNATPKSIASITRLATDPQAGEIIQLIDAALIDPSPWNRKVFSESGDIEMADSIRAHGIIQAGIVRPHPDKPGRFQLVAGERRHRGAVRVDKHYQYPAFVRPYTDKQALEVQKIENLQREDLDPIEEATGLRQMMQEFGYTLDDLIKKLGKQKSSIYARIKLANLCPEGVKHFRAGHFAESVATRIARIPLHALQLKFIDEMKEQYSFDDNDGDGFSDRDCAHEIEEGYLKQLKGAPFKTTDATLLPVEFAPSGDPAADATKVRVRGGACDDCPMRAGNLPDFDPKAGRADMCLNPSCYRMKVDAAFALQSAAHVEKGGEVADPAKAFDQYGYLKCTSGYTDPSNHAHEIAGFKKGEMCPTWAQVAAKLKATASLVQHPKTGEIQTLLHKPTLIAAAKQAGLKLTSYGNSNNGDGGKAAAAKTKRENAIRTHIVSALVERAPLVASSDIIPVLRFIVESITCAASSDQSLAIATRRALDLAPFKNKNGTPARLALDALAGKLPNKTDLMGLLFELAITPRYPGFHGAEPLKQAAKVIGEKYDHLEANAKKALDAAKPKAKPGKKPIAAKATPAASGAAARARVAAALKARWAARMRDAKKPAKKGAAK